MQTLHTNPTVVRCHFDYKIASEVAKKVHAMQTLHTNPTVVRFDFDYKKASEATKMFTSCKPYVQTLQLLDLILTIKRPHR